MGAIKHDANKPSIGLLPREALVAEAQVLDFGAEKYGTYNWKQGMLWSRLSDAALRHILAWIDGEDNDPETGLSHLAHARASLGFLIHYADRNIGTDDRYSPPSNAPRRTGGSDVVDNGHHCSFGDLVFASGRDSKQVG